MLLLNQLQIWNDLPITFERSLWRLTAPSTCVDVVFTMYCSLSLVRWCHLHTFATHSKFTSIFLFKKFFLHALFFFFVLDFIGLIPFGSIPYMFWPRNSVIIVYLKYLFWRRSDLQYISFPWEYFPVFIVHRLFHCTVTCSFSSWHCWISCTFCFIFSSSLSKKLCPTCLNNLGLCLFLLIPHSQCFISPHISHCLDSVGENRQYLPFCICFR